MTRSELKTRVWGTIVQSDLVICDQFQRRCFSVLAATIHQSVEIVLAAADPLFTRVPPLEAELADNHYQMRRRTELHGDHAVRKRKPHD